MIKNLIFDVYGTLVSTGNGSIAATAKIFREWDLDESAAEIYSGWKKIHKENIARRKAFKTEEEIFTEDLRRLFAERGIDARAEEKISPMIESLYGRRLFPDVEGSMEQIMRSFRVAIGSTTDDAPLLDSLRGTVLEGVRQIFTSERLRKYKPEREFYSDILRLTGWEPEETVFVGDSVEDDVIGPKGIGMKAVLIDRKGITDPDLLKIPDAVIRSLDELIPAVERMD